MPRDFRTISGRRDDLTGVRGPGELRRLFVEGSGVASLAGIERMTALDELSLDGVRAPELGRLASLPRLETLIISRATAVADWRPLERLTTLRSLAVHAVESADGPALAAVRWPRMTGLRTLILTARSGTIALAPLLALPALDELGVMGFALADAPLPVLQAAPRLPRRLTLPTRPEATEALIDALSPGITIRGDRPLYPGRG